VMLKESQDLKLFHLNNLNQFVKKCLKVYNEHKALYETDYNFNGFEWINANDGRSIYSFTRFDEKREDELLFIINYTPVAHEGYMVGTANAGDYRQVLSDDLSMEERVLSTNVGECDGRENHLKFDLRPYEVAVFERVKEKKAEVQKTVSRPAPSVKVLAAQKQSRRKRKK